MDTPIPVIAVISMISAAVWFTRHVMRNQWVKSVAKGGWVPLVSHSLPDRDRADGQIGAMLISSGTGMVLDSGVGKYRGFALLAISMTGLTGSIGAIHANRLSTSLHTGLHPSMHTRPGLNPAQSMVTLFLLGVPCQAAFVAFVTWAGWIDLYLGWAGWVTFVLVVRLSQFVYLVDLIAVGYLPGHRSLLDFVFLVEKFGSRVSISVSRKALAHPQLLHPSDPVRTGRPHRPMSPHRRIRTLHPARDGRHSHRKHMSIQYQYETKEHNACHVVLDTVVYAIAMLCSICKYTMRLANMPFSPRPYRLLPIRDCRQSLGLDSPLRFAPRGFPDFRHPHPQANSVCPASF